MGLDSGDYTKSSPSGAGFLRDVTPPIWRKGRICHVGQITGICFIIAAIRSHTREPAKISLLIDKIYPESYK
jgi:hypothetical protein